MKKQKPVFVPVLSEPELKDSFYVGNIGDELAIPAFQRLLYHQFILVEQGSGNIRIDDRQFTIVPNSLFLLSKGQLYLPEPDKNVKGYTLRFGDCFWDKTPSSASNCKALLFNNTTDQQVLLPETADFKDLYGIFSALFTEFGSADYPNKPDALAAYLKIIMIKCANIYAATGPESDNYDKITYRRFAEIASLQFKTTHDVATYAAQLHLTPRRLSALCKRVNGKTAKETINGYLIAEAKRALQFSPLPIKEIAYDLNFSTPEQFSHFFRKSTAFSPLQYRAHFLNGTTAPFPD